MYKYKIFFYGFLSAIFISFVIFATILVNLSHTALLSKLSSQLTTIEIVNQEDGVDKLKEVNSLTLVSDYCATKALGDYFFVKQNQYEIDTLDYVEKYIVSEKLTIQCEI